MISSILYPFTTRRRTSIRRLVMVVAAIGLVFVAAQSLLLRPASSPPNSAVSATAAGPRQLQIPSIGVDAKITELGLQQNGELEVPQRYEEVGWYEHSPKPGEVGPSILNGHLDSLTGPAVFARLHELRRGDTITVSDARGKRRNFTVESMDTYQQQAFPTEKVYGNIEYPGLRLITCSGQFDSKKNRYSDNLVVYARLASGT